MSKKLLLLLVGLAGLWLSACRTVTSEGVTEMVLNENEPLDVVVHELVIIDRKTESPEFCPIHKVPLQEDIVPIEYGLMVEVEIKGQGCEHGMSLWEAEEEFFPYANVSVLGGCEVITVIEVDEFNVQHKYPPPEKAKVRYCPLCREALEQWRLCLQSHN